jgi:hypothetical protein
MLIKRRLVACTVVIAALAVPVASAGAATSDTGGDPTCPASYNGPTNMVTGCPWYLMVDSSTGAPAGLGILLGPQLTGYYPTAGSVATLAPGLIAPSR